MCNNEKLTILLFLLIYIVQTTLTQNITVKLGVLYAVSSKSDELSIPHSLQIAQAYMASRPDLFLNIKFDLQIFNTQRNATFTRELFSQFSNSKSVGVIGPRFSAECELISSTATSLKLPYLGYTSTSSSLSNKALYPFYSRVISPDSMQTLAMISLAYVYEWYVVIAVSKVHNYT